MKRHYRLRKNADFQRIRRCGTSKANRLIVLIKHPNGLAYNRFGIVASKRIGKAVKRNKIKRQIREVARLELDRLQPGWDILLIARMPIQTSSYQQIKNSIQTLFREMDLLKPCDSTELNSS